MRRESRGGVVAVALIALCTVIGIVAGLAIAGSRTTRYDGVSTLQAHAASVQGALGALTSATTAGSAGGVAATSVGLVGRRDVVLAARTALGPSGASATARATVLSDARVEITSRSDDRATAATRARAFAVALRATQTLATRRSYLRTALSLEADARTNGPARASLLENAAVLRTLSQRVVPLQLLSVGDVRAVDPSPSDAAVGALGALAGFLVGGFLAFGLAMRRRARRPAPVSSFAGAHGRPAGRAVVPAPAGTPTRSAAASGGHTAPGPAVPAWSPPADPGPAEPYLDDADPSGGQDRADADPVTSEADRPGSASDPIDAGPAAGPWAPPGRSDAPVAGRSSAAAPPPGRPGSGVVAPSFRITGRFGRSAGALPIAGERIAELQGLLDEARVPQPDRADVLVVAAPTAGPSSVGLALALAVAAAAEGERVLLIEAEPDDGGAGIAVLASLDAGPGLGDHLAGGFAPADVLQPLSLPHAGVTDPEARTPVVVVAGELGVIEESERLEAMFRNAVAGYDLVVVGVRADERLAPVLSRADGVVLWIDVDRTSDPLVEEAVARIDAVTAAPVAVVGAIGAGWLSTSA